MNNVFSLQKTFEGRVFQVPDYQRGYAWEKRNWQDLWDDIEFLADGKNHYTGNLVLHAQSTKIRGEDGTEHEVFHVVDGQQRLTTLVILLACLREHFQNDKKAIADGLETKYICFPDQGGQSSFRLRLNSDCNTYFEQSVLRSNHSPEGETIASHRRLKEASAFFGRKINEKVEELGEELIPWRDEFHHRITQRLKLGHYVVDDASEVGVIFEVMNNRGKPLSELEKVKNYLLYMASKLAVPGNSLGDEVNIAWSKIFSALMKAGLTNAEYEDRLLRAHWLMAYNPARKEWAGSQSIKDRFHLRIDQKTHNDLLTELRDYVDSLSKAVVAFCEAFQPLAGHPFGSYPENRRTEVRIWAEKLSRDGVRSPFLPLLMAVRLRDPQNAEAYVEVLKACEIFEFRVFRWEGRRSNAGETRFIRLGYDFYHGQAKLTEVCVEIRSRAFDYLSNTGFSEGFTISPENNFYHWSGIRYLLLEYEIHLSSGRGVEIDWQTLQTYPDRTIEHILPQTPTDDYWKDRFDADALRMYTHSLGNLSLTLDNSSYGNKAYPKKCGTPASDTRCYSTASLFMEREIAAKFADWTPKTVKERAGTIQEWALERWHIDPPTEPIPAEDEPGEEDSDEDEVIS